MVRYFSKSAFGLVSFEISRPRMKTCSAAVVSSNGSPDQTTRSASLPTSIDPARSAMPQVRAGVSVTARSAASRSSPYDTALPASCRRLRALCVSNDDSASVTPARCSRAAFSSVAPSASNDRDVGQRLDHDRDPFACELVGHHPAFRGAEQDELQLELVAEPDRREQVAGAIGLNRERDLAADDRAAAPRDRAVRARSRAAAPRSTPRG